MPATTSAETVSIGSAATIWLVDLKKDGSFQAGRAENGDLLSPAEMRHAAQLPPGQVRNGYLASHAALHLLVRTMGEKSRVEIVRTQAGWPRLSNGWHFSLSRTSNWAGLTINPAHAVGLDIEAADRQVPKSEFLHQATSSLDEDLSRKASSIETWCAMEAYVKLHGLHLADLLDQKSKQHEFRANLGFALRGGFLHLANYKDDLTIALWSEHKTSRPEICLFGDQIMG